MTTDRIIDLGYRPRQWQAEFHRNLKRWNVAVLHRRAGKTILAIMTLIDKALRFQGNAGRFGYIAPFLNQSKSIAWGPLKQYAMKIPGVNINESELWIEFPHNKARIKLYGADNAEAMRGGYFDFIVLDELKDIKPEVWGDIIRPALSDREGGALFMGTPSGINLLSETYWKAVSDPNWNVCLRTVYDTEALPLSEIDAAKADMTDAAFAREFLCDFNAATDEQLISFALAEEASRRHLREDQYTFAAKIIGVDVAFAEDGDRSVIFPRQGLAAFKPKWWRGMDNMELADQVMRSWDRWQADAVFIDRGRGEGVGSRLVQLGYAPIMVDFGGRATNPIHLNKKTEMWFELLHWLQGGGAIPNLPELKRDLCSPQYDSNNAANKLQLERKELMKKRGLPSPDLADALCFVAGTMIETPRGAVPIEKLSEGDTVITPFGVSDIVKKWVSETDKITTAKFSNGAALSGKGEHKIFCWGDGVVRLDALSLDNVIESYSARRLFLWKILSSLFMGARNTGFKALVDIISQGGRVTPSAFFIAASGLTISVLFRKASMFITRMAIGATTTFQTLSLLRQKSTQVNICASDAQPSLLRLSSLSPRQEQRLLSGMDQKLAGPGTRSTEKKHGRIVSQKNQCASDAGKSSIHTSSQGRGSALLHVCRRWLSKHILPTLVNASGAAMSLLRTDTGTQNVAPVSVRTESVQATLVFNLTLREHNAYYANKVLVFNCLTFAFPVQPSLAHIHPSLDKRGVMSEFDPYATA